MDNYRNAEQAQANYDQLKLARDKGRAEEAAKNANVSEREADKNDNIEMSVEDDKEENDEKNEKSAFDKS